MSNPSPPPSLDKRGSIVILRRKKESKTAKPEKLEEEEKSTDSRAIENLQEFHTILESCLASLDHGHEEGQKLTEEQLLKLVPQVNMEGWVFQEVDFSKEPIERWHAYNLKDTSFWGCTLPEGIHHSSLGARGANSFENHPSLPFRPARAFMYTQEELMEVDAAIYKYYKSKSTLAHKIAESIHDFSIADAMDDYVEGRTSVGIMGGHSLWRHCEEYQKIVWLCREIARLGMIVVTGGGPGAMEAANLGAYLYMHSDNEVREALDIIGRDRDESGANYIVETAEAVLERFGFPKHQPSLGIPTYYYGHEPTNKFATFQAKYFSNALREADLLRICSGGIIFTRGAAGTRQEIFQYACQNHYAKKGEATPMIFFDKAWWESEGVFQLVQKTAEGREYGELLLCVDTIEGTIKHLSEHAKRKNLSLLSPQELTEPFWVGKDLREAYMERERQKTKNNGRVDFVIKQRQKREAPNAPR